MSTTAADLEALTGIFVFVIIAVLCFAGPAIERLVRKWKR